jgi:hypothetical protein
MSFAVALFPVVLYIFVVYTLDNFSLVGIRDLMLLVGAGLLAAAACFGLFRLTDPFVSERVSDYLYPILEEAVKALPLWWLARRKKIAFFIDSVICGAAVGGGFSILENVLYLLMGNLGMGTALFRGLEVALIHMGCSAIVAVALMFTVRLLERRHARLPVKKSDITMSLFLFFVAAILHILHNYLHPDPLLQFVVVFGSLGGLLVWVYQYDGDMIHRWLDRGLDKQVALMMDIQQGHLGETKTGQFLLSIKENFPAEVYFDIICYVELYIELAVAAKSRFMTREAGLDEPLDEAARGRYREQYAEFKDLEKALGKSARMTVAPVVKFYPADRKALDELLAECR